MAKRKISLFELLLYAASMVFCTMMFFAIIELISCIINLHYYDIKI